MAKNKSFSTDNNSSKQQRESVFNDTRKNKSGFAHNQSIDQSPMLHQRHSSYKEEQVMLSAHNKGSRAQRFQTQNFRPPDGN